MKTIQQELAELRYNAKLVLGKIGKKKKNKKVAEHNQSKTYEPILTET